ncbi:MAG TPA: site-specific DNA-methyltransferase [Anaerolineales bacterium]|nr:site-specific DNA-methyltransferase [Anaerolineales bacterium]
MPQNFVIHSNNLPILQSIPSASIPFIYIDPPFNTGKVQARKHTRTEQVSSAAEGDRTGYGGKRYKTTVLSEHGYADQFDDFLGFLEPRLREAHRILAANGSLYFHIDYREVHYCKILLDQIFGRENFLNEIIWAYDYGGRPKNRWPPKHDTILLYVKNAADYVFNYDEIEKIPYMAPGLVGPEKAARGKLPTDTWWHTIVSPTGYEKTGYPTQKPLGILRRMVQASSKIGDVCLDFFAGSGTTGAAALELGRHFLLIDENPTAIETMRQRFASHASEVHFSDGLSAWLAGEK